MSGNWTVSVVVAVIRFVPHIASIVLEPAADPVAKPLPVIAATPGEDEIQLTALLTSTEVPSLYSRTAENCWFPAM
jgi:hypothetical protein